MIEIPIMLRPRGMLQDMRNVKCKDVLTLGSCIPRPIRVRLKARVRQPWDHVHGIQLRRRVFADLTIV